VLKRKMHVLATSRDPPMFGVRVSVRISANVAVSLRTEGWS
jgi:hypothetical protein